MNDIERLVGSFEGVPVVNMGGYRYFVHPLSDGIPSVDPLLLEAASRCVEERLPPCDDYDMIVTAEAMGIPLAAGVSLTCKKPFSIMRKREYGLPGEVAIDQSTGYSRGSLYLHLPGDNKRAVIVDDVLSTGGTLRAMAKGVKLAGWTTVTAVVLFSKMTSEEKGALEGEVGFEISSVLNIEETPEGFRARTSQ